MRAIMCALVLFASVSLAAEPADKQPAPANLDKQLIDVLKDLHNRGADLFNRGDALSAYRLFQGALHTTRAVLTHRPDEQKFIDEAVAAAERLPTIDERAFALHKTIENLRNRMKPAVAKDGPTPELLLPPREQKKPPAPQLDLPPGKDASKKPEETKKGSAPELLLPPREHKEAPKKVEPPKDGVMGRLMWQGKPLGGVKVLFVSIDGKADGRETTTNGDGVYILPNVPPGRYTVVLSAPEGRGTLLPMRYASSDMSPLSVEVKGGDTLDFLLQ